MFALGKEIIWWGISSMRSRTLWKHNCLSSIFPDNEGDLWILKLDCFFLRCLFLFSVLSFENRFWGSYPCWNQQNQNVWRCLFFFFFPPPSIAWGVVWRDINELKTFMHQKFEECFHYLWTMHCY